MIVVGAGPTGLTAAALLARHGVDCVIVDRRPAPHPQPRAVHLDDEVCRILASIGVADEFTAISRPGQGLRLLDADMRVLAEFRRAAAAGRHGFPEANMFDQPDLERILRRKVSVVDGVEATELTQHGDHVRVNGERFEYALGCDGANSFVRKAIGASMRDLGFAQRWLVVDIDTDKDLGQWDGVHQVCDTKRAATFMRVGESRYRWEFRLQHHESAADYQDLARIRPLIAPWTKVEDLRLRRVAEYTFRAQIADKWHENRVFLLGDAAHLTPPFIGQGLGAGLRDAVNLTWKLAHVRDARLPASVLDTYQIERLPHVRTMIRLAKLLGVAMTEGGEFGNLLRRVLMPRLHLVPGLRNRVLSSETPALRRSELVLRPRFRRGLAGTLCPARNPDQLITVTPESHPDLADWLRKGRARAAVVRPDGVVLQSV
ncbi:bifunctional 3-(3-hydroxy-phenyl)propionate/3-hydroxycinnamic acid hydroxylase [Kutzneria sp. CA-103260]|uniref:bifunctional 3-(3-hydroxy-phenyl)propionate/3-hydroxycinnamic acid hydroxylase n=1 Tax=Kutzneria sp. CA-103260 TaxID=2802641 RepID=UPI0020132483|nr:bifunctional 3-(3-hydroxy-phenyl)propionate/3-hydroxycinnamic acid hydroxylase [Kutzneria sp. CA-103260]